MVVALIAMPWIIGLYMAVMYLVTRCWTQLFISSAVVIVTSLLLYFLWYRKLPAADELINIANSETALSKKILLGCQLL
jgi:hypothetical protein